MQHLTSQNADLIWNTLPHFVPEAYSDTDPLRPRRLWTVIGRHTMLANNYPHMRQSATDDEDGLRYSDAMPEVVLGDTTSAVLEFVAPEAAQELEGSRHWLRAADSINLTLFDYEQPLSLPRGAIITRDHNAPARGQQALTVRCARMLLSGLSIGGPQSANLPTIGRLYHAHYEDGTLLNPRNAEQVIGALQLMAAAYQKDIDKHAT